MCTGAFANEIIPNRSIARLFTKRKKDGMLVFFLLVLKCGQYEIIKKNRGGFQSREQQYFSDRFHP